MTPLSPTTALLAPAILLSTLLTGTGCDFLQRPPTDYAAPFPFEARQSRDLDIQVVREDTIITLSNSSAEVLPAGRLWVNQAFSRPVEAVPIGETVSFNLYEFRNRYDEPFRAGGFFATENPLDVVMVQWQTDTELIGLQTTKGEAELR